MIKNSIVEIIDDCYHSDDSLPDCDWSLNEEELVNKLADAIDKEKQSLSSEIFNKLLNTYTDLQDKVIQNKISLEDMIITFGAQLVHLGDEYKVDWED